MINLEEIKFIHSYDAQQEKTTFNKGLTGKFGFETTFYQKEKEGKENFRERMMEHINFLQDCMKKLEEKGKIE